MEALHIKKTVADICAKMWALAGLAVFFALGGATLVDHNLDTFIKYLIFIIELY